LGCGLEGTLRNLFNTGGNPSGWQARLRRFFLDLE
jgi:hypothetical protein